MALTRSPERLATLTAYVEAARVAVSALAGLVDALEATRAPGTALGPAESVLVVQIAGLLGMLRHDVEARSNLGTGDNPAVRRLAASAARGVQ